MPMQGLNQVWEGTWGHQAISFKITLKTIKLTSIHHDLIMKPSLKLEISSPNERLLGDEG